MLNTHTLDMILQLKYMPTVVNPAESPRVTQNLRNAMVCDNALFSKRVWRPPTQIMVSLDLDPY